MNFQIACCTLYTGHCTVHCPMCLTPSACYRARSVLHKTQYIAHLRCIWHYTLHIHIHAHIHRHKVSSWLYHAHVHAHMHIEMHIHANMQFRIKHRHGTDKYTRTSTHMRTNAHVHVDVLAQMYMPRVYIWVTGSASFRTAGSRWIAPRACPDLPQGSQSRWPWSKRPN